MAIVFVAIGLVVCTAFTLAPLSRRKANEAVAELAPAGSVEAAETARFDQLDAASERPAAASTAPNPSLTEETR
jgi:UDP-GlcNAc:undecaprenyl-phosphate GlcNAc-1-phosphate transferase